MALSRTIPALPVRDIPAAADFYAARLGFEALHVDEGIAVLRRDDAVVHLWGASDESWTSRDDLAAGPVRSGAETFLAGTASCRIEADDLESLHGEMASAGVLHPTDTGSPVDTDDGTRELHVLDLDGNLVTFYRWLAPGS